MENIPKPKKIPPNSKMKFSRATKAKRIAVTSSSLSHLHSFLSAFTFLIYFKLDRRTQAYSIFIGTLLALVFFNSVCYVYYT